MSYLPLNQSKVSVARGRGLVLAIDGEFSRVWNAISLYHEVGESYPITLDGGTFSLVDYNKLYVVTSESGVTDDLTGIIAASASYVGIEIVVMASVGHTITVKNCVGLQIGADFVLNGQYDLIKLLCVAENVFVDSGRSSND
jgi:hypothetical protein